MRKSLLFILPVFLFNGVACIVTTTNDTCASDAAVACTNGATGFTCSGIGHPTDTEPSLVCSAGVAVAGGDTQYCCTGGTQDSCGVDNTLSCQTGTGYSCTGSANPMDADPSLTCSQDTGAGTFCCTSGGGGCQQDPSVAGCVDGSVGYSCDAGTTPDSSSLSCSDPVASGSQDTFCCIDFTSSSCQADPSVTGCQGDAYGFSCTGSDTPDQSDSSLVCSYGEPGAGGDTIYCCVGFSSTSCMEDPTVTGCEGGSFGFSCTGTDTPSDANAALVCSQPIQGANGDLLYCCTG